SHVSATVPNAEVTTYEFDNMLGFPTCDTEVELFKEKAQSLLEKTSFDVVGISCWSSFNYISSVWTAKTCKKINPACTVVVGGYHPTAVPSDFTYLFSPFDFVVMNEGEHYLEKICRGEISKTRKTQVLNEQNSLLNPKIRLTTDFTIYNNKMFGMYLSRGCPYECGYCMEGCKGRSWKYFSIEDSMDFLEDVVHKWNPKKILFNDACFGVNPIWRKKFFKELVNRDYDIQYWAETRIDCIDEESLESLAELDFQLDFGIETFSEQMLSIMNKTKNPKKYLELLSYYSQKMDEREIRHNIYVLYNHPGETSQTIQESILWLENFLDQKNETFMAFMEEHYSYFPGSDIYYNFSNYAKRFGTRVRHPEWWKEKGDQHRRSRQVIPSDELVQSGKLGYYEQELKRLSEKNFDKMVPKIQKKIKEGQLK
ncbi:MAG: radical SAM protein, partial [Planctomycetota bacterium]